MSYEFWKNDNDSYICLLENKDKLLVFLTWLVKK